MSNPYEAPSDMPADAAEPGSLTIRKVEVRAWARLREARALIGDQYWTFVGLCFLALLINGFAQNLLIGPLMCGLHYCFMDRLQGRATTVNRMFDGFNDFLSSFLATLLIIACFFLAFGLVVVASFLIANLMYQPAATPRAMANFIQFMVLPFMIMWIPVSLMLYVPFVFVFPLIAEHKLSPWEAVVTSFQGALRNFWGIAWMFFLYMLLSIPCLAMCYIPFFLLVPLLFGGFFLLYRDVYEQPAT